MKNLQERIVKLESEGFVYETDYNAGTHILKQALVRETKDSEGYTAKREIKSIENGKIINFRTDNLGE